MKMSVSTLLLIISLFVIAFMGAIIVKQMGDNTKKEQVVVKSDEYSFEEEKPKSSNGFDSFMKNYEDSFGKIINDNRNVTINLVSRQDEIPGISEIYIDANNDLYATIEQEMNEELYKKYSSKYKIESDVANIFVLTSGNGGYSDIVILKKDGTAKAISGATIETGVIKAKNITNVKNAIGVMPYSNIGGYSYAFIDVDGNLIKPEF